MRLLLPIVLFLVASACYVSAQERQNGEIKDEVRVLFIGNSLTYSNDMPRIFEKLFDASSKKKLVVEVIAEPNFGLQDHWEKKKAIKILEKKKWDFVVLQQGPSASKEGRQSLAEYSRMFLPAITKSGAKPALFMVWPSLSRPGDFDGVISSYALAAKETHGVLLPVGCVFRSATGSNPNLKLYSEDGFHPSATGSYLAALAILKTLFDSVPTKLPKHIRLDADRTIEITDDETNAIYDAIVNSIKQCSESK